MSNKITLRSQQQKYWNIRLGLQDHCFCSRKSYAKIVTQTAISHRNISKTQRQLLMTFCLSIRKQQALIEFFTLEKTLKVIKPNHLHQVHQETMSLSPCLFSTSVPPGMVTLPPWAACFHAQPPFP